MTTTTAPPRRFGSPASTSGGEQPRWSADGRELFYLDLVTNELRVSQLRLAPAFEVVERRRLFGIQSFQIDPYHQSYDVLPGGRGFVFIRPRAFTETAVQPVLVMAENWFADLRSRLKR